MSIEIRPTDLMIGNYINDIHSPKSFLKVEEIRKKTVRYGYDFIARYEDLSPIPLTEEILLKVGGKRFDEDKIILMLNDPYTHLILMKASTYWFTQIKQTGGFASDGVNIVSLNFIGYLHQLQNLFKALTGNDLNIAL